MIKTGKTCSRFFLLFLFIFLFGSGAKGQKEQMILNQNWQFCQADKQGWLPAQVPGCVHTDLLANKKIPDPFYRNDEKDLQWIGEKDWIYQTSFEVKNQLLTNQKIELVFKGLDTYAKVYLNDSLVLQAANMHREWRIDCKQLLHTGKNNLRIYFNSIFKEDVPKYLAAPFKLTVWPNNDQSDLFLSVYARKAGYEYGWDWGPRLITSGIWRPVLLETWNDFKINTVQILQPKVSPQSASLATVFHITATHAQRIKLSVLSAGKVLASKTTQIQAGDTSINIPFTINHPKLWWTNGLGSPNLYTFNCTATGVNTTDEKNITTGIRSLQIVREADKDGRSFYVLLNGKPVFMKGSNYIPLDNFLTRVTAQKYEQTIKDAAACNMNMLRVWGGGIYEEDTFYNLCDKMGILVFQDMMFACGMFPSDKNYLDNVSEEITQNVTRLRNHPSIALWCGNNENEISWYGWGWKKRYSKEDQATYETSLHNLFYKVVPDAISKADTTRYYHPSSPGTGFNGVASNMGDVHYYGVWQGAPFKNYNSNIGRFMSEYGFQAFPDMKTIQSFTEPEDLDLYSSVMLSHQRAKNDETRAPDFGTRMIEKYMNWYYRKPKNFELFVYVSQILQAKGIGTAIEAHRRNMPYCMGTLYWQLNDTWPVISWSGIDYYGRWKAMQYKVKELYKEVMVSTVTDSNKIKVFIVSDKPEPVTAQLTIRMLDLAGKKIWEEKKPIVVEANTSKVYYEMDSLQLLSGKSLNNLALTVDISQNRETLASSVFHFVAEKDLQLQEPEISYKILPFGQQYIISLKANKLAKSVCLSTPDEEGKFSDNYFDILPGEVKEVTYTPATFQGNKLPQISVFSLFNSYQ